MRILYVDDNEVDAAIFMRLCAKRGHDVESVDSALNALSTVDFNRFDRAVVDLNMPGVAGFEVGLMLRNLIKYTCFLSGESIINEADCLLPCFSKTNLGSTSNDFWNWLDNPHGYRWPRAGA